MRGISIEFPLPVEPKLQAIKHCVERKNTRKNFSRHVISGKTNVRIGRPDRVCNLRHVPEWPKPSIDNPQADSDEDEKEKEFQPFAVDQEFLKDLLAKTVHRLGKSLDLNVNSALADPCAERRAEYLAGMSPLSAVVLINLVVLAV